MKYVGIEWTYEKAIKEVGPTNSFGQIDFVQEGVGEHQWEAWLVPLDGRHGDRRATHRAEKRRRQIVEPRHHECNKQVT